MNPSHFHTGTNLLRPLSLPVIYPPHFPLPLKSPIPSPSPLPSFIMSILPLHPMCLFHLLMCFFLKYSGAISYSHSGSTIELRCMYAFPVCTSSVKRTYAGFPPKSAEVGCSEASCLVSSVRYLPSSCSSATLVKSPVARHL